MRNVVQSALLGLCLGLVLPACGEDNTDTAPAPPPPRPAAQQAAAIGEPEPREASAAEEMFGQLERPVNTAGARDPFTPPRPEADGTLIAGGPTQRECDLEANPIGDVPLNQISVMGIITGTPVPRAMVVARSNPQAFIINEGAFAGSSSGAGCTQELVAIRDNELVFETRTNDPNMAPVQTVLQMEADRVRADIDGDR